MTDLADLTNELGDALKEDPQFTHMAKASRPQSGALRGAARSQDDSSVSQAAEATSPANVKERVSQVQDPKDSVKQSPRRGRTSSKMQRVFGSPRINPHDHRAILIFQERHPELFVTPTALSDEANSDEEAFAACANQMSAFNNLFEGPHELEIKKILANLKAGV